MPVASCALPDDAILQRYRHPSSATDAGAFTDCYTLTLEGTVTLADFVNAFYTTAVFKLERIILKYLARKPSSDEEAKKLSRAEVDRFSAWAVEDRTHDQLLMCDFRGRTRSWFMVVPMSARNEVATKLYFGSAVVPAHSKQSARPEPGKAFGLLLGLHRIYSIVLLHSAGKRLGTLRGRLQP
jgi:hypothetical protein